MKNKFDKLNKLELEDLEKRAKPFLKKWMPQKVLVNGKNVEVDFQVIKYSKSLAISERQVGDEEKPMMYEAWALLKSSDGNEIQIGLQKVVDYFESVSNE